MNEAANLHIEMIGGNCPVQAEGTICGKPFYFGARGSGWTLDIDISREDTWSASCSWGKWPDAGYMPEDEARRLIEWCASEYARTAISASPAPDLSSESTSGRGNENGRPEPNLEGSA